MRLKRMITFFFVIVLVTLSWAQEKPSALFETEETLELTLVQNTKALRKDIKEERSYHPAQLSYMDHNNREITLNVSVKTRGKSRRNPRLCDSPPLAIKFDPRETKNTPFKNQKKLKLVTHCRRKGEIYEQYVLQEYLVYKLYNILTEKSFRVRLVHMTYVDSRGKYKPIKKYAFFIEHEEDMAKRNNGKMDDTNYKFWVLRQKEAQMLFSVFQYMIGNTDWSIPARHNVKLIRAGEKQSLYAVPYDFDMSGIVYTHYSAPHQKLRHQIKSVRSRLYRGLCRKQEEFTPVLARFNQKKEEIYALYNHFPLLETGYKKDTLRYLDGFYKIINKPKSVRRHLVENCRKLK